MSRSASHVLRRLSAFRERYGMNGAIYKSIDVALHKCFRASVHEVVWLDIDRLAEITTPEAPFSFRFLTADEVTEYARDPSYFIDGSLAAAVREGRELCFAALASNRLAAFGCYTLAFVPPEQAAGAAMSFPADVAYMSYGFTHPDFRGSRLHGLVMGLALKELSKRGVTKLVSIVAWTNWASLKSCSRLGYLNLGKMITVGGKKRAVGFYPKNAKRRGVRFGDCAQRLGARNKCV
jgi:hypothetical protein